MSSPGQINKYQDRKLLDLNKMNVKSNVTWEFLLYHQFSYWLYGKLYPVGCNLFPEFCQNLLRFPEVL